MKITVLTENTASCPAVSAEHGLSLFAETDRHVFLFDTGQTDTMVRNAQALGVDLNRVEFAVISHGHYDHGGGLSSFFKVNDHAPAYLSKSAFGQYYHGEKYIGLDPSLKNCRRIIAADDETVITDGMTLYTCNGRALKYPLNPYGLSVHVQGRDLPDSFLHEQYLLVEENGRRILFSGCSHKGILNIMEWMKPDVLIGGFHFMKVSVHNDERRILDQAAEVLNACDTEYYTCHCTGEEQYFYLKERMGKRLHRLMCGDVTEV